MNASPDKTNIDPVWVKVAAADSPEAAKAVADFVCSGEHDEETIQRAIDLCAGGTRNLYLYDGIYNIDAFREWEDGGPRAAVRIPCDERRRPSLQKIRTTADAAH